MKLTTQSAERYFRVQAEHDSKIQDFLQVQGFGFKAMPFWKQAYNLDSQPFALGRSLAAYFGYIYIQDKSSMLPSLALELRPGDMVLDLCASPGSKTGMLSQMVGPAGLVVANEPNPSRLATLRANLQRQSLSNVASLSYPGEKIPLVENSWSHILLDAPCSGWGTEQKNPKVKQLWSEEKVRPLVLLQRDLLRRASRLLAPGGRLVYSTCTTNIEENQKQVYWAEQELGLKSIALQPFPGFSFCDPGSQAPGSLLVDGQDSLSQGFFIACLTKSGGEEADEPGQQNDKKLPGKILHEKEFAKSCTGLGVSPRLPAHGQILIVNDKSFWVPQKALELLSQVRWQGLPLGSWKKNNFIPYARSRCLLSAATENENVLVLQDIADIERLIAGQSLSSQLKSKYTGLYWRSLPLGWLRVRSGRCLWTGKA